MHKICTNVQKKICIGPRSISPVHLYAFICKICKHESHLQNMQKYAPLTFLMSKACTEHALKVSISSNTSSRSDFFQICSSLMAGFGRESKIWFVTQENMVQLGQKPDENYGGEGANF